MNNITQRIRSYKYIDIYNKISKIKTKFPFELKANEYASLLVKRLIIADILIKDTTERPDSVSRITQVELTPVAEAPAAAAAAGGSYQSGGAPLKDNQYWTGIFFDYINPFFKKYLDTTGESNMSSSVADPSSPGASAPGGAGARIEAYVEIDDTELAKQEAEDQAATVSGSAAGAAEIYDIERNATAFAISVLPGAKDMIDAIHTKELAVKMELESILSKSNPLRRTIQESILDMTYIDDLFTMLEPIASNPYHTGLAEQATILIDNIFKIQEKIEEGRNIYVIRTVQNTTFDLNTVRDTYTTKFLRYSLDESFLSNMMNILEYFNETIKTKAVKGPVSILESELTASFNEYMNNVYPSRIVGAAAGGPGAPGATGRAATSKKGGDLSRNRRRRNGSPRRKSLKNR